MKNKKHGAFWWIFISWWWLPIKWVCIFLFQSVHKLVAVSLDSSSAPDETLENATDSEPLPNKDTAPQKKTETHRVSGTSFHLEDITELMGENPVYSYTKRQLIVGWHTDERIYELEAYTGAAVLEPEPDNPHDSKAIKVVTEGVHIGYIKAGSCAHIHNLMRDDKIESVQVRISGGRYKVLDELYNADTGKSTYSFDRDTAPISAVLTLTLKPDTPTESDSEELL